MRLLTATVLAVLACDAAAQLPISKYVRTYTSNRVRGYFFQSPKTFVLTRLQVPDETRQGKQYVAVYRMKTSPPRYPQARPEKAIFYKGDVASGQIIPVVPPIVFKKGEWVGILGACSTSATSSRQANSYGSSNFGSRITGTPVVLRRFITQRILGAFKGNVPVSSSVGPTSRVRAWIAGQGATEHYGKTTGTPAPKLVRSDPFPPSIGYRAELVLYPGSARNKGGVWVLGLGRTALNLPGLGTINVKLPFLASGAVAGPIPSSGATIGFMLAKNPWYIGKKLNFQAAVVTSANQLTLTNGAEMQIGL